MSTVVSTDTDKTKHGFYDAAARKIAAQISSMQSGAKGGPISLFTAGGSTPGPIYQRLSETDLHWNSIRLGLVDERWVDEDSAGSNAALIRKTLLQNKAKKAAFFPMKNGKSTAALGQPQTTQTYRNLLDLRSIAILGMGTDGHFAGCFPGAKGSEVALNKNSQTQVQAITPKRSQATGPYLDRITLTLSALMSCEKIFLLITGEAKRDVIENAINDSNCNLPIAKLLEAAAMSQKPNVLEILYTP